MIDGINGSEISTYQRCRWQWKIQYESGIVLRYDRPYLSRGTAIHKGIEAGLKRHAGQDVAPPEDAVVAYCNEIRAIELSDQEKTDVDAMQELAIGVATRTIKWLDLGHKFDHYRDTNDKIYVEHQFRIPVPESMPGRAQVYHGTVDWICRYDSGVWLLDWKSYSTFQPVENEEYNSQMTRYQRLLRMHGIPSDGSIILQIRPQLPKEPELLKSGKGLKQSDLMTDWDTYLAAILRNGFDPNDYQEMFEEKLKHKEFWRISKAYRSDSEIEASWVDTAASIEEVCDPNHRVFRSRGAMTCPQCQVKDLCHAQMRNEDVSFLMQTQYRLKSEKPVFQIFTIEEE